MSRLDRLAGILDTGSTAYVRATAAQQLGDLAKAHPDEIPQLLARVYPHLLSKSWDTRVAGAKALGGIAACVGDWNPEELEGEDTTETPPDGAPPQGPESSAARLSDNLSHLLTFGEWDLAQLLSSGHVLLANGSGENGDRKRQKVGLVAQLGLGHGAAAVAAAAAAATAAASPVKTEVKTEPTNGELKVKTEVQVKVKVEEAAPGKPLSARMKALARRRAKSDKNKSNSPVDLQQSTVASGLRESPNSGEKTQSTPAAASAASTAATFTPQHNGALVLESTLLAPNATDKVWVLQGAYELFLTHLFDPAWEIRHGASLALREIVREGGSALGRVYNVSREENNRRNRRTLEDLALRLLCVFAMDRFGDYVSDTVVAPVRENTAQVLAVLLKWLDVDLTMDVYGALCELIEQPTDGKPRTIWEAKHGGLLGLRYFVSLKTDILLGSTQLLGNTTRLVLACLASQGDDDVQTVAAGTLIPITEAIVVQSSRELLAELVRILWTVLGDGRDDLSAATGAIMDLLAKLCQHPQILAVMKETSAGPFSQLVPRLYPFLRHSIPSVRMAVLRTLLAFLEIKDPHMLTWTTASNGLLLRLLLQNFLFEQNLEARVLNADLFQKLVLMVSVENIFDSHFLPLLDLLATPVGLPRFGYSMDPAHILKPVGGALSRADVSLSGINAKNLASDSSVFHMIHEGAASREGSPIQDDRRKRKRKQVALEHSGSGIPDSEYDLYVNIDAPIINGDITLVGSEPLWLTRVETAKAVAFLLSTYTDTDRLCRHMSYLHVCLASPYATHRIVATTILGELFTLLVGKPVGALVADFKPSLLAVTTSSESLPFFRECVPLFRSLRVQCQQLLQGFQMAKVPSSKLKSLAILVAGEREAGPGAFTLADAKSLVGEWFDLTFKNMPSVARIEHATNLNTLKAQVQLQIEEVQDELSERSHVLVGASATAYIAAQLLAAEDLPQKLNPFIRALMDAVKSVKSHTLQNNAGEHVVYLIDQLIPAGKHNIVDKMVKNLCAFLCVDPVQVPEYAPNKDYAGILTLKKDDRSQESLEAAGVEINDVLEDHEIREAIIKRRGGKLVLDKLVTKFKDQVFVKLTNLKALMVEPLEVLKAQAENPSDVDDKSGQNVIDSFELIKCVLPNLDSSLTKDVFDKVDLLLLALQSPVSVWRFSAAECFASMVKTSPAAGFELLVRSVLPLLQNGDKDHYRMGAIEAIYHVVQAMGSDILPYVVFLIVPVLGRMSDSVQDVRLLATTTFAHIIKLVPLEAGIPDPVDMSADLLAERAQEREFLQQMMDPSKIESFELPVAIKASLRKYQQEGVNWLRFLNKYHLHGILCDDMGLGKTLQTICIIASDHHMRAERFKETGAPESKRLSTLIVCPPSLTGHWEQEFKEYSPFMKVMVYAGPPSVRSELRKEVENRDKLGIDVVVTSYDVLRNDGDFLTGFNYNYCVLDEGHIIKNAATRLTKVVKCIKAEHRLVLSGTPIQNNVVELWSLFDFLMPGFLGTEKQFHERFAKPIAQSRTSKGKREQERGALALESLHKQVLPFMLRRLKEDVLSDLPPKIIQDYYCELSDLQKQLYQDFIKKQRGSIARDIAEQASGAGEAGTTGEAGSSKQHVFQVLQYMRKLCNHPSLVLTPKHPQYSEVTQHLRKYHKKLEDIENAPKLVALKTLLRECGIGGGDEASVIAQHRVLIFFQMKDMMDIVEHELLNKHMPKVTYLRMDGATDPRFRQELVQKFNNDPSIDVMLLTTKVGGLGLNLTSADTVIFVEHDWNPMNDLQAMDRTHRLGQKRVVNVYRLITKDTLEEKIMGLQKFKMEIANTIVNQQNAGLASMDTHQLLDLFEAGDSDEGEAKGASGAQNTAEKSAHGVDTLTNPAGVPQAALRELPALWDERQYAEEYNMDDFIDSLR